MDINDAEVLRGALDTFFVDMGRELFNVADVWRVVYTAALEWVVAFPTPLPKRPFTVERPEAETSVNITFHFTTRNEIIRREVKAEVQIMVGGIQKRANVWLGYGRQSKALVVFVPHEEEIRKWEQ